MTPKERAEKIGEFADNALAEEFKLSWAIAEAERQIREAVNEALGKAARLVELGCLCRTCGRVIDIVSKDEVCRKHDSWCDLETVSGTRLAKAIREMKV